MRDDGGAPARPDRAASPYRSLSYSDPYGLCPEKAEEGAVCLDFYIAAKSELGFKGNGRGTDPNARAENSKVQVVVSRDGKRLWGTVSGSCTTGGRCTPPYGFGPRGNRLSSTVNSNGSFTVTVHAKNSAVPFIPRELVPAIDAEVTFTPNGQGGFTTSGNRDAMPTLDIFQRVNGEWVQLPGGQGHRPEAGGINLIPTRQNDRW